MPSTGDKRESRVKQLDAKLNYHSIKLKAMTHITHVQVDVTIGLCLSNI
jgi:hypothetical protein